MLDQSWIIGKRSYLFQAFCLTIFLGVIHVSAHAQKIIHVPADEPTIQAGIDAASNGDTVLVAPGIYKENIDFEGKAITVTSGASNNSGAAQAVIEGSAGPTVTFGNGEPSSAVLNGFTIEHVSSGTAGSTAAAGDGIFITGASPTISNNIISGNLGCGISILHSSSPLIEDNDIRQNTYLYTGAFTAVSCGNTVALPPGAGIGVFEGSDIQIIGNTIEENNSDGCGAGITGEDTQNLLIEDNVIHNNQAACSTAAFLRSITNLFLIQNLIYDNVAQPIAGSSGAGNGSGIFITANDPLASGGMESIVDNTVYGNRTLQLDGSEAPSVGEQLYIDYKPAQSYIENNIFDNTDASQAVYCGFSGDYDYEYNDTLNATAYIPENCSMGGPQTGDISANPLFLNPAKGDFHLPANSPAVAAGNIAAPGLPTTDLGGLSRTYDGKVDMGVYEYHPPTSDTIALTSSANPSYLGQFVTLTATVTPLQPHGALTGTISFDDGSTNLATVNISPSGIAALNIGSLSVGTHPITAIFSGDTAQQPSTSNIINQIVALIGTKATLTSSQNPAAFGQKVTFSASVQSALSNDTVPGSVSFYDGSTLLGSAALSSGDASFSTSSLSVGSHSITAEFLGSPTHAASTSNTLAEVVTSDFGITVTPNARTIYTGSSATATVTLTPNTGFTLPVTLSCSGLPANSSCIFSPASISGNGSARLTIQTAAPHQISALNRGAPSLPWRGWGAGVLSCCVFLLIPRQRRGFFIVLLILLTLGAISGCGAPGPVTGGTPPGIYIIKITGTSALGGKNLSHSTVLTLDVKSYF